MKSGEIYPLLDIDTLKNQEIEISEVLDLWESNGFRFFQLRAKGLSEADYLRLSAGIKQNYPNLEIIANDHHSLFVKEKGLFSGIHLGQEDYNTLTEADCSSISQRVSDGAEAGISTHSVLQIKKAIEMLNTRNESIENTILKTSEKKIPWTYIALGPIFPTISKPGAVDPVVADQELIQAFSLFHELFIQNHSSPALVLIGGLTPDNYGPVRSIGKGYVPVLLPAMIGSVLSDSSIKKWKSVTMLDAN